MTDEELRQNLITKFSLWKAQVFRLVRKPAPFVNHALNTLKINGYSLNDLIAIIRGEVSAHENNHNRPHSETLTQLGGMTRATYESTIPGRQFPKDGVPLSKIPQVQISMAPDYTAIGLPALDIIYFGRKLTVPAANLQLGANPRQYLKMVVTGLPPLYNAQFVLSNDAVETLRMFTIGWVDIAGGVATATSFRSVRIGAAVLSTTPRGMGIPVTSGTQAAPANIPTTWFE